MKTAIRVALSATVVIVMVACSGGPAGSTSGPTSSPISTASPSPTASPSAQPTPPPSPTIGPPDQAGFPTSILGLAVHSVAGIHQLAAAGQLDGRLAAVGGYWAQFALPCPYMPHQPVILGFCSGGSFADTAEAALTCCGSGTAPIATLETADGDLLWSAGGIGSRAAMVVLIVHVADSRSGQCEANDRSSCLSRLVIDSVAWVNGDATSINPDTSALPDVALTVDDAVAAGVKPGEQVVTAYPLLATDLNDVEPRLLGQGSDVVWFLRVLTGTPDADAISDGAVRLVSDSSAAVVAELPLVVPDDYEPARVVLDAQGWDGNGAYPRFTVSAGTTIVAAGDLDSSSTPLALVAGDYTVHAFIASPEANPVAGPTCDQPLTVAAGDDVAYYADFSGSGDCTWKAGTLFP